ARFGEEGELARLAALYAGLVVDHPVTAVDGLAGDPVVARAPARGGDTEVGVGVLDPGELVPDDHIVTAGGHIGTDGQVRLYGGVLDLLDRKSTRLNSSHVSISYAVFCLKKKRKDTTTRQA